MKETMETLKCKAVHVAAGAAQTAVSYTHLTLPTSNEV